MVVRWVSGVLAALVCASCVVCSPPGMHYPVHFLSKRSFLDLECKGVYDRRIFSMVDRICTDCYELFREHQLHTLCRTGCFTSYYYKGCTEALQLDEDEVSKLKTYIKQLHGGQGQGV